MKQTAVEWYAEQSMLLELKRAKGNISITQMLNELSNILEQSKEMEKEQIMTAFTQGDIFGADFFDRVNITAEKYYKQTYESKTRILPT